MRGKIPLFVPAHHTNYALVTRALGEVCRDIEPCWRNGPPQCTVLDFSDVFNFEVLLYSESNTHLRGLTCKFNDEC
jgi:hypothetical protein